MIMRSAAAREEDTEAAASSPFLFTRVRAAIAAEQRLQEEGGWLSMILVARRAVPAMALVAILAALLTVWSAGPALNGAPAAGGDEEALFEMTDPGVEQTVLASRGLSRDDVFNIVVDRNYEVKGK